MFLAVSNYKSIATQIPDVVTDNTLITKLNHVTYVDSFPKTNVKNQLGYLLGRLSNDVIYNNRARIIKAINTSGTLQPIRHDSYSPLQPDSI